MPPTTKRRLSDYRATKRQSLFATLATYVVATLPVIPALLINIEQAQGKSRAWMSVAIVGVLLAPAAVEAAGRATGGRRLLCAMVALLLTLGNVLNAVTNATNHSDHKSDHRRAIIAGASDREKAGRRLSLRRDAQVKIAGEVPPATIEAEIGAVTAANSGRWNATEQCSATKITAEQSRTFCAEVSQLRARFAAARERDKIDGELSALGVSAKTAEPTPDVADPYAESVAALLGAAGVKVGPDGKRAITASRDWVWAVLIEVTAALGPMILLWLASGHGRREPAVPRAAKPVPEASEPPERAAPNPIDDPVYAFIAVAFERKRGINMRADEPWQLWLAHCAETGAKSGSQRAFGMAMKACFQWERNHNRPRYLNVTARKSVVGGSLSAVA